MQVWFPLQMISQVAPNAQLRVVLSHVWSEMQVNVQIDPAGHDMPLRHD